jgi:hypothetical protein
MTRLRLAPVHLPADRYRLRIRDARDTTSRQGHPMLRVTFEVDSGPHAGHPVTCCYSLLPQALWHLRRLLRAAGLPHATDELDTTDLVDVVLDAYVTSRPNAYGPPLCDLQDETPVPRP